MKKWFSKNSNKIDFDIINPSKTINIKTTDINILLNRVKINKKKENKKKVVLLLIIASFLGVISLTTIF